MLKVTLHRLSRKKPANRDLYLDRLQLNSCSIEEGWVTQKVWRSEGPFGISKLHKACNFWVFKKEGRNYNHKSSWPFWMESWVFELEQVFFFQINTAFRNAWGFSKFVKLLNNFYRGLCLYIIILLRFFCFTDLSFTFFLLCLIIVFRACLLLCIIAMHCYRSKKSYLVREEATLVSCQLPLLRKTVKRQPEEFNWPYLS